MKLRSIYFITRDHRGTDKMSTDKMSTDIMSTDKMPTDKMPMDKMSTDKMSTTKIEKRTKCQPGLYHIFLCISIHDMKIYENTIYTAELRKSEKELSHFRWDNHRIRSKGVLSYSQHWAEIITGSVELFCLFQRYIEFIHVCYQSYIRDIL